MTRKRREISGKKLNIFQHFLVFKLSAAGASYVVTSKSSIKRFIWVMAILSTFCGMSYMIYQVIQEYTTYPTVMISKPLTVNELTFPGVTVCGLNLIPKKQAREAELQYIEHMTKLLYRLPKYNATRKFEKHCRKNPLCYWSWMSDTCTCAKVICESPLCYDYNERYCVCSKIVCNLDDGEVKDACNITILEVDNESPEQSNYAQECLCERNSNLTIAKNMKQKFFKKSDNGEDEDDNDNAGQDYFEEIDVEKEDEDERKTCSVGKIYVNGRCIWRRGSSVVKFRMASKSLTKDTPPEIISLLEHIKFSETDDLRDIERFYRPSLDTMYDYSIRYDNLVLSCNFGFQPCDRRNFTTLYNPTFGKCYMFNFVGKNFKKQPLTVTQSGSSNGLQLYLRSSKKDSIDLLTQQLGVRVVIHDPRRLPFASQHGIDIRPGDMASISLEYSEVHRLGPPWGKCANQHTDDYSGVYNQIGCDRKCMSDHTYNRCGCIHPMFLIGDRRPYDTLEFCNINNNATQDECFATILRDRNEGHLTCNCPSPCKEVLYSTDISSGRVNPEFFRLIKTIRSLTIQDNKPTVAEQNDDYETLGLRIYFQHMIFVNNTETPSYSWQSLVANIGGNMGLFLGLSLITFLEILEFIFDLIAKILMPKNSKKFFKRNAKIYIETHSGKKQFLQ